MTREEIALRRDHLRAAPCCPATEYALALLDAALALSAAPGGTGAADTRDVVDWLAVWVKAPRGNHIAGYVLEAYLRGAGYHTEAAALRAACAPD